MKWPRLDGMDIGLGMLLAVALVLSFVQWRCVP